jgi:hypothetical protein
MPAPYSGNPSGTQSPSPAPSGGGVPIFNIPVAGDRGPDLWAQPLKTAADWLAFFAAQPLLVPSGQLLRTSVLTIGVSLAKVANCRRAHVRMVGGGGGGAGAGFTQPTGGGGGAAGGYAEFFTGTVPAVWNFAIGAGGTAGLFNPTNGGNGGSTTFYDGVTTVTAFGGGGGDANGLPGLSPALSTFGTINGSGEPGGAQNRLISGRGGSSLLGGVGGLSVGPGDADGNPGLGYGAGGSGGFRSVSYRAGGAGSAGVIILQEYS